eukprot:5824101-Alexandrium_andersonii.AAC.1
MSLCLYVCVSECLRVSVPVPAPVSLSVSAHVLLRARAVVCMDGDGSDRERSFGLDFGHLLSVTSQEKGGRPPRPSMRRG